MENFSDNTPLRELFNMTIDSVETRGANSIMIDVFDALQKISNENFDKITADLLNLEMDNADAASIQSIRDEFAKIHLLISLTKKKASSLASHYDAGVITLIAGIRDSYEETN